MSRFVRPETRTLTLEDGESLVVRARLSNGEQRALFSRLYTRGPVTPEAPMGVLTTNPDQVGLASVTAYLLDWTLKDDDGKPVHIHDLAIDQLEQILNDLTPEAFDEIYAAIARHDGAMREAREAEKKTRIGGSGS